jgi:hypothetical protein
MIEALARGHHPGLACRTHEHQASSHRLSWERPREASTRTLERIAQVSGKRFRISFESVPAGSQARRQAGSGRLQQDCLSAHSSRTRRESSASIFSYVPGGDIPAPQRNAFHDEARECCQPGSKPFDLNTGAAVGPVRNRMRAFAASCALEPAPIPPVKTVRLAYSPGSGPTN